jgi:hypothetical protein
MANILQREFSLPVVKVAATDLSGRPAAHLQLVLNVDRQQMTVGDETHKLAAFGYAEHTGRAGPVLEVPQEVRRFIADWVHDQIAPSEVLWLYLVKPYGALGAVPWERDLQQEIEIPLLRLPDALPEPDRPRLTFDVALCITAAADGPKVAARMGADVARALADSISERLRLHVFADLKSHSLLEHELGNLPVKAVTVHDPRAAQERSPAQTGPGIQNSWLAWIRREIRGKTLDAVHFVSHGCTLGYEGAILTTPSPTYTPRLSLQAVQSGELRRFLTQVGALVVGFTRPYGNKSDYGLRRLVDELGSMRAGPVLLHDPQTDPDMKTLGQAYRFLSVRGPARPPADPSIMLYAQPHQVAGLNLDHAPEVPGDADLKSSSAVKEHFSRDDTPRWLAAAERFIEDREAEVIRFQQSKRDQPPTPQQEAYFNGVQNALRKMRVVVNQHAERRL